MAEERESIESESYVEISRRRYWRRTDVPRPWWPWGVIPVLGLILLFLIGGMLIAPRIEAEVRNEVAERLAGVGQIDAEVMSDGQGVTLSASAPLEEWDKLYAVAKSTQCSTWAGELTCPTSVDMQMSEPVVAPVQPQSRPHRFTFTRTDNTIRLTGEVPDLAEHDRILGVAGARFGEVVNEMTISNEAATENYARAADTALAVASQLTGGEASWSGQALSVVGSASTGAVADAREQFGALGTGSVLGEFNVRAIEEGPTCNDRFADILSQTAVRFETGSANIGVGNDALFASLAEVAGQCSGSIIVEGHTDSQGDADMNQALSLARASAVRDALIDQGIDGGRVTATGFGETRPVADNTTADGRARNRRIVITMDDMN